MGHLQIMPLQYSTLFGIPKNGNAMMEDTALATLQRSLSEAREAKRKIQARLTEIESEAVTLRSQLSSFDIIIEQTEAALRRVLFPSEAYLGHPTPPPAPRPTPPPPVYADRAIPQRPFVDRTISDSFDPGVMQSADIDDAVAQIQQSEKSSNIRFNDFRIPQAATIILREANVPLHVSEIYRRMQEGGFEFRGQHKLITLAVSLSRSKRFRKVAPGTFEIDPQHEAGRVA